MGRERRQVPREEHMRVMHLCRVGVEDDFYDGEAVVIEHPIHDKLTRCGPTLYLA